MTKKDSLQPESHSKISRRKALFLFASAIGFPVAAGLADWLFQLDMAEINDRPAPDQSANPDLNKEFGVDDTVVEALWHRHMESVVDPNDGQPILSLQTWRDVMTWVTKTASVYYNQLAVDTRSSFPDFLSSFIAQTVEYSDIAKLNKAVFFETFMFSAQNVNGLKSEQADIGISHMQVAFRLLEAQLGGGIGERLTTWLKLQIANPYGMFFRPPFRDAILKLIQKHGLAQSPDVMGGTFVPTTPFLVAEMPIPTVGAMDLDMYTYAHAVADAQTNTPVLFADLKNQHGEFVNHALDLDQQKNILNADRSRIQTIADALLLQHPHLLDGFFDPAKAPALLESIGVGEMNLSFSRDSMFGYVYDQKHFADASQVSAGAQLNHFVGAKGSENYAPDEQDYFSRRKTYILHSLVAFYQSMYQKNPASAARDFMADQIFNPKFQAFLRENVGGEYGLLNDQLHVFDAQATRTKATELDLLHLMDLQEFNPPFQMEMSVLVTKTLLERVKTLIPRCGGDDRSSLYWQMYLFMLTRELTAEIYLGGSYMRPDVDPPYNDQAMLSAFFSIYYKKYVELGIIGKDAMPNDFATFTKAEGTLFSTRDPGQYGPSHFRNDIYQQLISAARTYTGPTGYDSWYRSLTIGSSLGIAHWGFD